MAAGLMRQAAGDAVEVHSAGTDPGEKINALSAETLAEAGADMTGETPQVDRSRAHPPRRPDRHSRPRCPSRGPRGRRAAQLGHGRAVRARHRRDRAHAPGPRRHRPPRGGAAFRTHRAELSGPGVHDQSHGIACVCTPGRAAGQRMIGAQRVLSRRSGPRCPERLASAEAAAAPGSGRCCTRCTTNPTPSQCTPSSTGSSSPSPTSSRTCRRIERSFHRPGRDRSGGRPGRGQRLLGPPSVGPPTARS